MRKNGEKIMASAITNKIVKSQAYKLKAYGSQKLNSVAERLLQSNVKKDEPVLRVLKTHIDKLPKKPSLADKVLLMNLSRPLASS